ncbi:metal-dependent hydrolase [Clostridium tarantellae]|nr:metal-dependent hydrolase [Clostridium tarantellae]
MNAKGHAIIGAACGAMVGATLNAVSPEFLDVGNKTNTALYMVSVIKCTAGAVIGALIVDIDTKKSKASQFFVKVLLALIWAYVAISILNIGFLNNLLKDYYYEISTHTVIVSFAILCTLGKLSPHRQFTHKVVGTTVFCIVAYYLFEQATAIGFMVGYISHILLDKTTKAGLKFFDIKLPLQDSRGNVKINL